mmetsp:Transcript_8034/g.21823  ORF Transcript_8034/g.21823 Transcript_8034/m.21823 type:complete len:373 (-) Transcript_8034:87-1205(-)
MVLQQRVRDDRWQLVMISNKHHSLQPGRVDLHGQGQDALDIENLRRLLHEDVVEGELEVQELLALDGRVGTSHRDDLGLLGQHVPDPVTLPRQHLKRPERLQLIKDPGNRLELELQAPTLCECLERKFYRRPLRSFSEAARVLLPPGQHVELPETGTCLAGQVRVRPRARHDAEALTQLLNLVQKMHTSLEHRIDAPQLVVFLLRLQKALTVAEANHLPDVNVLARQFLENIVQSLVGMGDDQCTLARIVVVQRVQYLHGRVRLPRSGWADDQAQSGLQRPCDRSDLSRSEFDRRVDARVGPACWIWGRAPVVDGTGALDLELGPRPKVRTAPGPSVRRHRRAQALIVVERNLERCAAPAAHPLDVVPRKAL